jgi:hypothetical protein
MLPSRLYHYTDLAGLTGVVESGTLWATDIHNLNDITEVSYSREMLGRLGETLSADLDPEYAVFVVGQAAAAMATSESTPDMFVASLSDDGDNLSQWRSYASLGRGIAIGFDREELEKRARAQGFTLVPIMYETAEQETHLLQALTEAVEIIRDWGADPPNAPTAPEQVLSLGLGLTFAAMFVKSPFFRDEREWRLVRLIVPGVWDARTMKRKRNGVQVLFEEIELIDRVSGETPIVELVIGPLAGPAQANELREFLDANGLESVSIRRSSVPLRTT